MRERPESVVRQELGCWTRLEGAFEQSRACLCRGSDVLGTVASADGWSEVGGALEREFHFDSYLDGIAFVSRLREAAATANHHPEITVGYEPVTVRWAAHWAAAITDREMAERTNAFA